MIRGAVLTLVLGVALSGVALAIPQKLAPAVQVAGDSSVSRQPRALFEQHTCNATQPAATIARLPYAADDWRVLLVQLFGVYALSFGLVRALFAPAGTRRRTAHG